MEVQQNGRMIHRPASKTRSVKVSKSIFCATFGRLCVEPPCCGKPREDGFSKSGLTGRSPGVVAPPDKAR
jgi:hypothetical protein